MRVFTRVVERRSFTLAAADLGLPRSTVTDAVKQLEARLGVRLLERTTRQVNPTLDGEAHYRPLPVMIADLEDAEAAFGDAKPKGLLRVDVHGTLARHFVMPRLPDFLAEYPGIELYMSEGDRLVDLIREGIDCVLRVGDLQDSDMIARRVAMLEEITCAGPAYIDRFGQPASVDDLDGHLMVGFHSSGAGALLPLEFVIDGTVREMTLRATVQSTAPRVSSPRRASVWDDSGAALSRRGRSETGDACRCTAGLPALVDAGVAALPAQPAAIAARSRVHRLADAGVRAGVIRRA